MLVGATSSRYSRQRLDFDRTAKNGDVTAFVTVTLSDGTIHRFEGTATAKDARKLAAHWTAHGKAPASTVAKIAAAKALDESARGLALVADTAGPLRPHALAMAKVLGVTGRLTDADIAANMGAAKQAANLVKLAKSDAARLTKGDRSKMDTLLRVANEKRKAVKAVESKKRRAKAKKKKRAR